MFCFIAQTASFTFPLELFSIIFRRCQGRTVTRQTVTCHFVCLSHTSHVVLRCLGRCSPAAACPRCTIRSTCRAVGVLSPEETVLSSSIGLRNLCWARWTLVLTLRQPSRRNCTLPRTPIFAACKGLRMIFSENPSHTLLHIPHLARLSVQILCNS
jgi:hypothetical protein